MSVAEAAAWARVDEHVIRDAIKAGRLRCVRIGRQVRIRRGDLFALNSPPAEGDGEPGKQPMNTRPARGGRP